jgi:ABC-type proline/glycine betaine transport system substrate-binding protein
MTSAAPAAYEFIKSIALSKDEVNQMEADINEAGDPEVGVKAWLEDNRSVVQPWTDAAKKARET